MRVIASACSEAKRLAIAMHPGRPFVAGHVRSLGPTRLVRPDGEVVMSRPIPRCRRRRLGTARHVTIPPLAPVPDMGRVLNPPRQGVLESLEDQLFGPDPINLNVGGQEEMEAAALMDVMLYHQDHRES